MQDEGQRWSMDCLLGPGIITAMDNAVVILMHFFLIESSSFSPQRTLWFNAEVKLIHRVV